MSACSGFTCSRNALAALNVLYIMVACLLIGVAATARIAAKITNVSLMGGLIACGVILLLIAIVGLVGAVRHHQVFLFFYMIILFLLFLVQFAVACACLALTRTQQETMVSQGWKKSSRSVKRNVQEWFNCCSFNGTEQSPSNSTLGYPSCTNVKCCSTDNESGSTGSGNSTVVRYCPKCQPCNNVIKGRLKRAIKLAGIIGLIFSLTEILGVCLAVRFRNLKNPRADPSAFL
ncbi:Tetraspanin-31-A [Lamellibrachia satsuma]|nr:Tetraspanin-31-A [Lamellibrachia satsuma]